MTVNKSLVTNLVSIGCVVVGYLIPSESPWARPVREIGLYATSGAITNWIAIYMLFERVPGFYGSGVIPSRFEDFKTGIKNLIMNQFFTRENVSNFFRSESAANVVRIDPDLIVSTVDFDAMFERLRTAVMESPFGGMLGLFGGAKALEPLRGPFRANVEKEIRTLVESPKLAESLRAASQQEDVIEGILEKVQAIVQKRLDELTPSMVKDIVQDMIRQHLGWLVVWGGVFGALIGLAASFLVPK
jgi:uncharacterized membrane protein YheB (UPF0754 family)